MHTNVWHDYAEDYIRSPEHTVSLLWDPKKDKSSAPYRLLELQPVVTISVLQSNIHFRVFCYCIHSLSNVHVKGLYAKLTHWQLKTS